VVSALFRWSYIAYMSSGLMLRLAHDFLVPKGYLFVVVCVSRLFFPVKFVTKVTAASPPLSVKLSLP